MPYSDCVAHLALAPMPAAPPGAALANYSCRATEPSVSKSELDRDRDAAIRAFAAQGVERYIADSRE